MPRRPVGAPAAVPFYRQTMDFSCGPACAAMVLRHFGKVGPLTRDLEVELWRETHAVEVGGADRFGLSIPFALRGLSPHIISDCRGEGFLWYARRYLKLDRRALRFFRVMQQRRASQLGVTQERRPPTLADLFAALHAGSVPIALVSTKIFVGPHEDIPHWVVITGVRQELLSVHNPLDPPARGHRTLAFSELFQTSSDFRERTVVVVGTTARPRSLRVPAPPLPRGYLPYEYELRETGQPSRRRRRK